MQAPFWPARLRPHKDPMLQLVSSMAYIFSVPFTFLAFWLCGWCA